MASKKGIILTITIFASITAASFLIWVIPTNTQFTLVTSDYESNLDNVIAIRNVISNEIQTDFADLLNEKITPQEYIERAEISSTQINSQTIQLIESDPTEEWLDSYFKYIESLKKLNAQITETIVVANLKISDSEGDITNSFELIESLKNESDLLASESEQLRP